MKTVIKGLVDNQGQEIENKTYKKPKASSRNYGEWLADSVNGVKEKTIDGRQAKWFAKCNAGRVKWVVSHSTATHDGDFIQKLKENKEKANKNDTKRAPKKLKLNAEMAAAMQTLTGEPIQEAESDNKVF